LKERKNKNQIILKQEQEQNMALKNLMNEIEKNLKKYDLEKNRLELMNRIKMEWKEVARRLDLFCLVISFITIITVPAYLFGEYYFRDLFSKIESQKSKCGCENN